MSGAAWVIATTLLIIFTGALVADWFENRRDWREWQQDHHEPPSRLDILDGAPRWDDPWIR